MRNLVLLFVGWFIQICLWGQELNFRHLSVENGLSSNHITDVLQDSIGFIWIATANGLNRYDGYEVEVVDGTNGQGDLASSVTNCLASDTRGNVWIGTRRGLSVWDTRVAAMAIFSLDGNANSFYNIGDIYIDQQDGVWVLAEQGGFHLFLKRANETNFRRIFFLKDPPGDSKGFYGSIVEDRDGNIWVGTSRRGLWRVDSKDLSFQEELWDPAAPLITSLYFDVHTGGLWVGTLSGLYRKKLPHSKAEEVPLFNKQIIRSVYAGTHPDQLFIGTDDQGLFSFNTSTGTYTKYGYQLEVPTSLRHNAITAIYHDKQGILWVGTVAGGVSLADPYAHRFVHFNEGTTREHLSNNAVTSFAQDLSDNIWIGTDRGGLNYLNVNQNKFSYFKHQPRTNSISSDIIQHILINNQGQGLWIGYWSAGLDYFDFGSNRFIHFQAGENNSLISNTVNYLFSDSKNNLWIGTDGGISKLTAAQRASPTPKLIFKNYYKSTDGLSDNFIRCIGEDHDGTIWVGTWHGLNRWDPVNDRFDHVGANLNNEKIFTDDNITCIKSDSAGRVLIGTNESGLLVFFKKNNTTEVFNKKTTGFPSNTIMSIEHHRGDEWWIGTPNGLVRFNLANGDFTLFNRFDGLPSNEFRHHASLKLRSGQLVFGGNSGFVSFNPAAIRQNPYSPPPVITQLRINNDVVMPMQEGILDQHISFVKKLELKYIQSSVMFEFVSLSFTAAQKNTYAFMMQGLDKKWNYVGSQRYANYSYLPPGNYTFLLKASNNSGVWSEVTRIELIVHYPWWATWQFKLLMSFFFLSVFFAVYKLRTKQLRRQRSILEDTVKSRTFELENKNSLLSERQAEIVRQKEQLELHRDSLEKQNDLIKTLNVLGQEITSSLQKDELVHRLFVLFQNITDFDLLAIGYIDHRNSSVDYYFLTDAKGVVLQLSEPIEQNKNVSTCIHQKQSLLVMNEEQKLLSVTDTSFYSGIYEPLFTSDSLVMGVLMVLSKRPVAFQEMQISIFSGLASYIGVAFENAKVYEAIESQSKWLKEKSEQLDRLDKAKTNFFINLSHEFKTPLTLILAPLEKIVMSGEIPDSEKLLRQATVMYKNASQLLMLINELIEVKNFNIENEGTLFQNWERVDVGKFVGSVIENYEELRIQLHLNFHLTTEPEKIEASIDVHRVQKILVNLISNAVKYTPGYGTIAISVRRVGQQLIFEIADTGTGIPESLIPHIFERYQSGDPVNEIQRSSGIGLAYVHELVNQLKGSIEVKSSLHVGTTFIVKLPLLDGTHEDISSFELPGKEWKSDLSNWKVVQDKATILVVEDNAEIMAYLRSELEDEYNVLQSITAEAGIEICNQYIPDLVLSDIMLPGIDGIDMCKRIKENPATSHIPVILLTAKSGDEFQYRGLSFGADDYVAKPFNILILKVRIRNAIELRRKLHKLFSSSRKINVEEVIESHSDRKFMEELNKHVGQQVSNTELNHELLSGLMAMSKTQLYRKVQAITGSTVHEYIRNYRLRYAHDLLDQYPEALIFEIAYQVGFKDAAYFSKCFFGLFNYWPSEIKANKKR